jgi:hypothetical protein
VLIEDCEFRNSNSRQIIHLGTNTEPETFENALIFDNVFKDHAQDARQNDHSTIYMVATVNAQFENVIEGNTFSNGVFGHGFDVATALEIHGRWNRIEANTVSNYRLGANVIAIIGDNRNTRFLSNDFDAVSAGFHFWVYPGFEMVDTVIDGNYVEQTKVKKGDSLLDWKNVYAPVRDLVIKDNTFTSSVVGIDTTNRVGRGLSFKGYLHDALVQGNTISNVECVGIRIGGPVSPSPSLGITVDAAADALSGASWIDGLILRDNLIQNPGSWGAHDAGCSVGVSILSTDTPTGYQMTGIQMVNGTGVNRIEYTSDANNNDDLLVGVRIRSVVNESLFEDVEIAGDVVSDYATPAPDFSDLFIHHHDVDNSASPSSQQIRACDTSTWKTSLGVHWTKSSSSCDSSSGWHL